MTKSSFCTDVFRAYYGQPERYAAPTGWESVGASVGEQKKSNVKPLNPPKKPPQPLPTLTNVDPQSVGRAWNAVSARYPKISKQIKEIRRGESGELPGEATGEHPTAAYRKGGVIMLPNSHQGEVKPSSLFHEITHAAQDVRGQLKPRDQRTSEEFMAIEGPAHARGAAAKSLDAYKLSSREPRPDTPPQILSSGSKERPYIKMLYPDGRRIEYLFGDHVNMLGALNHRRNGGRLAKLLEDAHDTGIVAHKTDLGTGRKMLSNRQKKEWKLDAANPAPLAPDWETNPSIPEPGMEGKYAVDPPAGHTRLYRGERKPGTGKKLPEHILEAMRDDPNYQRTLESQGRWFTDDPQEAQWYVDDVGNDEGHMTYLDLPTHQAEPFRVSNMPDAPQGKLSPNSPTAFSRRPTKEFFLPREIASTKQPLVAAPKAAGAQPMDKYAVKKPRSIFDTLPDLSDPGREEYASKVNLHKDLPLFDKPALSGPAQTANRPPATSQKTLLNTGDYLPDMSPGRGLGSRDATLGRGLMLGDNPPVTAQRSLVAGGESIAPPPTKATETVTKTIKGRPLSDERRAKKIIDDAGTLFHIHNQDIHGLPPDAAVKLVKYLVHEGKLFRLSHVDHPQHGNFIHIEHGTPSDIPHEGRGLLTELQAASPEAHQAMKYLPSNHPLVKLASEMLHGPSDITKTTKTGVKRAIGAGIDPELARKRASFLANVVREKGKRVALRMAPPSATPPTEGRTPVIGGHANETVHPQLPTATGPTVTPSQQLNPKTRRFGAFSLSASAKQFADAVVERYTQTCQENDLLQRFAAAYYGEVERYGGQQAGHHIDFEGFNNGIPATTMMQPMKLQLAVGAGQPRHGRGSGTKAGTFAPNPLSGASKYATAKSRAPTPGQANLFEAPLSPDLPKPEHNVPFGATSTTAPSGKDWHIKALDEIGLAPAKAKTKPAIAPAPAISPLDAMFKPPRNLKKMSDAELVGLHHQRDEAATNRLFKSIRGGVEYMMRKFPKYRDEIQSMIGSIDDAQGNPGKGTFQIALETYDPNRLGQDGKPASFATHHRNVLYNYVRNRPKRQQAKESMIVGGKGRGEYAGDDETSLREEPRSREENPADALLNQGEDDRFGNESQPTERKDPELLVDPRATISDPSGQLRTASFKRGEGDRPLASDEEILRAANPQGRAQKAAVLNLEAKLVKDHLAKMSPEKQWAMQSHLSGMSPEYIAAVLSIPKGADLKKEASNNAALQHVIDTPSLHKILDDDFRSRLFGMLDFKERGKRHSYPLHKSVANYIRSITNELENIPGAEEIRKKREAGDTGTKFGRELMRVYYSEPAPAAAPVQRTDQPVPASQSQTKTTKISRTKGHPAGKSALGQRSLLPPAAPYALTAPAEILKFIPDNPTGHPATPKQPLLEGNEKWALHTGESSDFNELKKLNAVATKRGLIFKIKMPPSPIDKQQMGAVRWFTFTPAKWKERFTQRGRPEKYGLAVFTSPRPTYGGTGAPSGQKTPSSGSGALGAFVAGLVGGRRGGSALSRAFAPPKQTKQPVVPKPLAPPRALTAAEADRLGNEMSQQQKPLRSSKSSAARMIDYPDLSTKANEGKKAVVKSPKAGKASAQAKSPEDAAKEEEHRRLKLENNLLSERQRNAKLKAIERGEVPQGRGRRSKQETKTEQPPKPVGATLESAAIKLENRPPNPAVMGRILRGADTAVHVGDQILPAYYAWGELDDVIGSHELKNGEYVYSARRTDPSEQPRSYKRGTADHTKIEKYGDEIEKLGSAPYYVSPIPKPQDGPMTVDDQNLEVSNGSGRRLIAERLRSRGKYHIIANEVTQAANDTRFSGGKVTPDDVKGRFKHPILFRIVPNLPAGSEGFKALASAGNENITFGQSPTRAASQLGNTVLTEDIINEIVNAMQNDDSDATVGDLLTGDHPVADTFRQRIPDSEKAKWMHPDGTFNSQAKALAQDMVLSRFVDIDALEKGSLVPSLTNALGSSAAQLLQVGMPIKEPLQAVFKFIIDNRKGIKTFEQYREQRNSALLPELKELTQVSDLAEPLLEEFYKAKGKTGQFGARKIRDILTDLAKSAAERTKTDPLWKPVETVRPMLTARAKDPSVRFSPYEQRQFQKSMEDLKIQDPQAFLKMPIKEQIDILQSRRQKAATSATMFGAEDVPWLHIFRRQRELRKKSEERKDQLLEGIGSLQSRPKPASEQIAESSVPAASPAVAASQPKSPQRGLFAQRHHHDATRELYSAVHAAYYQKTTFPPQRVARKNSAPQRSKVH